MIDTTLTPDELARAKELSLRYAADEHPQTDSSPDLSVDESMLWWYGYLTRLADGMPDMPGVGPLKAARYATHTLREAFSDELMHDETQWFVVVREWLGARGFRLIDDAPEADA